MANAGSALKFAVVGPSISRKDLGDGLFRRRHSWSCDEACEFSILECAQISAARELLERCSETHIVPERLPAPVTFSRQQDKHSTPPSGSEENHSTSGGSGTCDVQSSAEDEEETSSTDGDLAQWPDTDSDDGFCSAWDLRRRNSGSEAGGVRLPHSPEPTDTGAATQHPMNEPIASELEQRRSAIKMRPGMVLEELTTLMIRNLPISLQQGQLTRELDRAGFAGLYDFCHLPVWTASCTRKGYAFVNMISTANAEKLSAAWHKTRQLGLGMKSDDQALDIVAANVQGYESNMAMVNEPRKRRGKAARSAKPTQQSTRAPSTKAASAKASAKGSAKTASMPVATPGPVVSAARAVTSEPAPGTGLDLRTSAAPFAETPKHNVLGLLGFAALPGGSTMPWSGAAGSPGAAPVSPAAGGAAACQKQSGSAFVLSVSAPGSSNFTFIPR